jgi:RimJ/RimL family protein N-acetyltransferase
MGAEKSLAPERRVRLRQVTDDDAAMLALWRSPEYVGRFNDFGVQRRQAREVTQEQDGIGKGGTLIVEVAAGLKPIGAVSWRAVRYGPTQESLAWNIGIELTPEARGHGFGGEAQSRLADHLFATTTVNRIEAMTDVENLAEQRALEKAGFRREGVLVGAQFRAAAWHDLVVYAVVRGSWTPGPPEHG